MPTMNLNLFEGKLQRLLSLADAKLSVMLQRLSAGRQFELGEPVLLHAVDEGRAGDAEQARGL